jgi:hypothetical protein
MRTATQSELASSSKEEAVQALKDEVVRELWKKGGRACVADLANELSPPTSARELNPIVESLAKEGVVRPVSDPEDTRAYEAPYQIVYELSR